MARINVKATVTAPEEINIPLVRADHASTSNIFRIFFEIFLSIFSCMLGFVLSLPKTEKIHWVSLTIFGIASFAFLFISINFSNQSKCT